MSIKVCMLYIITECLWYNQHCINFTVIIFIMPQGTFINPTLQMRFSEIKWVSYDTANKPWSVERKPGSRVYALNLHIPLALYHHSSTVSQSVILPCECILSSQLNDKFAFCFVYALQICLNWLFWWSRELGWNSTLQIFKIRITPFAKWNLTSCNSIMKYTTRPSLTEITQIVSGQRVSVKQRDFNLRLCTS
jgi:hypothetical protein